MAVPSLEFSVVDTPTDAPISPNGGAPRRNPAEPRPVPTAYKLDVDVFVNPATQQRMVMIREELHSATGIHITFWEPEGLKRRIGEMRSILSEAVQAENQTGKPEIITPPKGIFLPPGVNPN